MVTYSEGGSKGSLSHTDCVTPAERDLNRAQVSHEPFFCLLREVVTYSKGGASRGSALAPLTVPVSLKPLSLGARAQVSHEPFFCLLHEAVTWL